MPISPNNFDKIFKKLGIQNFKTTYQCSWDNYKQYNELLKQVQEELWNHEEINQELKNIINAHSFLWLILDINENDEKNFLAKYHNKDREAIVKARNGQGFFREELKKYWKKCCSITGCDMIEILIASHIKPWKKCNEKEAEAIDVYNGLLLIPNIDKLFDKGLISFSDKGKIIISSRLKDKNRIILGIKKDMKISKIDNEHLKYFDYHRKNIFKK